MAKPPGQAPVGLSDFVQVSNGGVIPSAVTDGRRGKDCEGAGPENQEDFGLAALRLVEQDKREIQAGASLLVDELPDGFEGAPDGSCKSMTTSGP